MFQTGRKYGNGRADASDDSDDATMHAWIACPFMHALHHSTIMHGIDPVCDTPSSHNIHIDMVRGEGTMEGANRSQFIVLN